MKKIQRVLRVYISTGAHNYMAARVFMHHLREEAAAAMTRAGADPADLKIEWAYDWTVHAERGLAEPNWWQAERTQLGYQMSDQIRRAHALVILPSGMSGTYTEAGMFLAACEGRTLAYPMFIGVEPRQEGMYAESPFYGRTHHYFFRHSPAGSGPSSAKYVISQLNTSYPALGLVLTFQEDTRDDDSV